MKILVIGGAGFIGSHTVDALIEEGHMVRILDSLEKPIHLRGKPDYLNSKADFVLGDIRDRVQLERATEDMDVIYNFAAYQDYALNFSKYFSVNSSGTALLYEIIVQNRLSIQKVIVASSQAVMGEGRYVCHGCHSQFFPDIRLQDQLRRGEWDFQCPMCRTRMRAVTSDESVINPQNQYGISKYAQESVALNLGKRYSIPTVCLRYSIVQGCRQSFYNTYSGALRIFCLHLLFNKSPTIYEDGNQLRDYVNIQDVVRANVLVLKKQDSDFQTFNVGGEKTYTVKRFYEQVAQVFGKDMKPRIPGEYRYGDTRHIFSDISKLRSLGWQPKVGIDQSISEYKQYLEEQVNIEDMLEYQNRRMKDLRIVREASVSF
jgi:dTDP-L-rhamnose 4-epimerase